MDNYVYIVGCLATLFFLYVAYVVLFKRIMFDRMLINGGSFMLRIALMVILTPFLLTFLIKVHNIFVSDGYVVRPADDFMYATNTQCDEDSEPAQDVVENEETPNLFWTVYFNFIDPGSEYIITNNGGKVWAIVVAMFGTFLLNGLLVSMMVGYIDSRKDSWLNGKMRYPVSQFLFKKFAVVIGANEMAPAIIRNLLCGKGVGNVYYVVLLTNEDVEKVRSVIESYLTKEEEARLIIYNGQLDSKEEISRLHLRKATEIYVLGEDSHEDVSESYHDVQNMRCVHNIASYLADREVQREIVCRVMFEFQTTYSVFQFSDLNENIRKHLDFIPFNPYENWAQRVLVKGNYEENEQCVVNKKNNDTRYFDYLPLDGKNGISPDSEKYVHFVIIGMSKMGVAMAIQAAQVAHYPNFKNIDAKGNKVAQPLRTRITFIDEEADTEMEFFMGRFQNLFALSRYRYIDATCKDCNLDEKWIDPLLCDDSEYKTIGDNFMDIEWEFVKGGVEKAGVVQYLKAAAQEANGVAGERSSLLTVAVCYPLAHQAIAAGIYMPAEVYDYAQQILVYQREASDIVYNLTSDKSKAHKRYAKLRSFGMQYADFTTSTDTFYRAMICNYLYTMIDDKALVDKILHIDITDKERSMKPIIDAWKKLAIFDKWSNSYLANSFETKIRSIAGDVDDVVLHYNDLVAAFATLNMEMAECEHNRWNMQQLLMGFRAFNDNEMAKMMKEADEATSSIERQAIINRIKKEKKSSEERAHLNIRSFDALLELDSEAYKYDEIFNGAIPAILKCLSNGL